MRKIHFGCGKAIIAGWENYDRDVDMAKDLPMANDSTDYIFSNHSLEHVTPQQGFHFLKECYRILKHQGVMRVGVPDIKRILSVCSMPNVNELYTANRGKDPIHAVEDVIFKFGHQSVYTADLLDTMLRTVGFSTIAALQWNYSPFSEFNEPLSAHHHDIVTWVETSVIDAWKT
jgi:predicted SAM-dependent methyltransferase